MILPQAVDHAQHHHPLVIAHRLRAQNLLLGLILLLQPLKDGLAQLMPGQFQRLDLRCLQAHPELVFQLFIQPLHVPLVRTHLLAREFIQKSAQNTAYIIFQNQFFLFHGFQQHPPHAIDGFALLVHHVVVLQQVFAGIEVLRLHRLLRALDALGDHARLDGHVFFHAQLLQQRAHPLLGEDAHQVVFQREKEPRLAGIALPSRAPTELVVDAPRLVPLGAQDEEPAGLDHLFVIHLRRLCVPLEGRRPLRLADLEFLALVVETQKSRRRHGVDGPLVGADNPRPVLLHQFLPGHELRVAAQQNIGSAAGHVGGNGHHPQPPGLGHNLSLALVELGVQHHMLDALAR